MSDALSCNAPRWPEITGQQVELLPARTLLTFLGDAGPGGDGAWGGYGGWGFGIESGSVGDADGPEPGRSREAIG